jgi:hypothetical protein
MDVPVWEQELRPGSPEKSYRHRVVWFHPYSIAFHELTGKARCGIITTDLEPVLAAKTA